MKALSINEIQKMAAEIVQNISERMEALKKEFGSETWSQLNHEWAELDKEISSKKIEIPDWSLDTMLAMSW